MAQSPSPSLLKSIRPPGAVGRCPTPCTPHPAPHTQEPMPRTPCPAPQALHPRPASLCPPEVPLRVPGIWVRRPTHSPALPPRAWPLQEGVRRRGLVLHPLAAFSLTLSLVMFGVAQPRTWLCCRYSHLHNSLLSEKPIKLPIMP